MTRWIKAGLTIIGLGVIAVFLFFVLRNIHQVTTPPTAPVRYTKAPAGIVELDRGHYWIKDGFAQNAWHLCEHGIDHVDHSTLDAAGNTFWGHYQLTGGAVLVCKASNDHYLFTIPKGQ